MILLVVGIVLNIIGLIYMIGSFLTPSGEWFFGLAAMIIGGILIQIGKGKKQNSQKSTDSLDILKNRYAKGEITKEEFERMKKDLET